MHEPCQDHYELHLVERASLLAEDTTFFERLKTRWQNNKTIAISVFVVAALLSGIKAFDTFDQFFTKVSDKSPDIEAFNANTQPIYFQGRTLNLVGDDCTPIDKIVSALLEIRPRHVILRSHTSRVVIGPNLRLTFVRGTLIGNEIMARLEPSFAGNIVVVSFGGAATNEAEGEYSERVEVFLSNDASVLTGEKILTDSIPARYPWSRPLGRYAGHGRPWFASPCFLTL